MSHRGTPEGRNDKPRGQRPFPIRRFQPGSARATTAKNRATNKKQKRRKSRRSPHEARARTFLDCGDFPPLLFSTNTRLIEIFTRHPDARGHALSPFDRPDREFQSKSAVPSLSNATPSCQNCRLKFAWTDPRHEGKTNDGRDRRSVLNGQSGSTGGRDRRRRPTRLPRSAATG